eukprot:9600639-Prorocentrum_lima.AAC.1
MCGIASAPWGVGRNDHDWHQHAPSIVPLVKRLQILRASRAQFYRHHPSMMQTIFQTKDDSCVAPSTSSTCSRHVPAIQQWS